MSLSTISTKLRRLWLCSRRQLVNGTHANRLFVVLALLTVVALITIMAVPGDGGFIAAPSYAAGTRPSQVVVGDFNGDGIMDLAISDQRAVSILIGTGDGSFQTATVLQEVLDARLAVGDFNGDGRLDLVLTNRGYNVASVYLGNGDGTFQPPQNYDVDADPIDIAVADFNGDGHLDLAVANVSSSTVSILLGNGDGTFQDARNYKAGTNPRSVVVADFNLDGHPDLAVSTFLGITSIWLGNGDGTFQIGQDYPFYVPVVGDFNGDGIPDFAAGSGGMPSNNVSIYLGNGDGTFRAANSYDAAPLNGLQSLAVGDFNADGASDIAVSGLSGITILLGNGDGAFRAGQSYSAGTYPISVAVGDFNRDGRLDVVVCDVSSDAVTVLLGNGDGSFRAAQDYLLGLNPSSVVTGDFNGDGIPDLAVAIPFPGTVNILLGKGDGTFQAPSTFAAGGGVGALAVADFNGDGKLDIATANLDTSPDRFHPGIIESDVRIFLGNGDGTFQAAGAFAAGVGPISLAVGDFNGDGVPDLAVADQGFQTPGNTLSILLGNGDGTFAVPQTYAVGNLPRSVVVGDFNRDGHLDVVVVNSGSNTVSVLLGNGDGTFGAALSYPVGSSPQSVAVGDFNGDGFLDLAVANQGIARDYSDSDLSILLGNGDGTFQAPERYVIGFLPSSVAVGDFDHDGYLDVVVHSYTTNFDGKVAVLLGNGDGTFRAVGRSYAVGSGPATLAVVDLNGDSLPDLAVTSAASSTLTILLNDATWP